MTSSLWGALAVAASITASSAAAAVIDTFETPASVTSVAVGGLVTQAATDVPGAFGRTRTLLTSDESTTSISGGSLLFTQSAGLQPDGGVAWETFTGPVIDFTTAVDLTEGGAIDAFELTVLEQSLEQSGFPVARLGVETGGGGLSALTIALQGPGTYRADFSGFFPVPGFSPADFTQVVSVGLLVYFAVGTGSASVRLGPVTSVPEPDPRWILLAAPVLVVARHGRRRRSA